MLVLATTALGWMASHLLFKEPPYLQAVVVGVVPLIIAAILFPGFLRANAQQHLGQCKQNLERLAQGMGDGLICPAAGASSYKKHGGELWCEGTHHRRLGIEAPGYPRYIPGRGIVERP